MKQYTKKLLIAFFLMVIIKLALSSLILAPSMFNDEYLYAKKAQNFLNHGNFLVHGKEMSYSVGYPVVISIAYAAKNISIVFFLIKLLNAFLSTLILIPSWLLAREFLDERKAFIATILILCLPGVFAFSGFILTENLFYSLAMFAVYFSYKAITTSNYRLGVLAGLFISIASFVKYTGLIFLLVPLFGYFVHARMFHKPVFVKQGLKMIASIYLPLIIVFSVILMVIPDSQPFDHLLYSDRSDLTAVARHQNYVIPLISWFTIYTGFIMLSSGVLLGVLSFFPLMDHFRKVKFFAVFSWFTIGLILFVGANHAAGGPVLSGPFSWFTERPIGRYVDVATPLVMILGVMGFEAYEKRRLYATLKKGLVFCSILLVWTSQLNFTSLFPVNNMPLTHFGLLKISLETLFYGSELPSFSWLVFLIMLATFVAIPVLFIVLNSKRKLIFERIAFALIVYFLVVGCLVYAIASYNAYTYWYSGEQMTLGRWIGDNLEDDLPIFINKSECFGTVIKTDQAALCDSTYLFSGVGFFVNNPIIVGELPNVTGEVYILSSHELPDAKLIKQTERYYVYKA